MLAASSARLGRCCFRCVSGSPLVTAAWNGLVNVTLLLFGRSLLTAVLGAIGVFAALEAYQGALRGSRVALKWYALYNVANVVVSVVVGIVVLAGVDVECAGADNIDACQLLQSVTGILLFAATSSASFFAAVSATLAYVGSRDTRPSAEAWKLDM